MKRAWITSILLAIVMSGGWVDAAGGGRNRLVPSAASGCSTCALLASSNVFTQKQSMNAGIENSVANGASAVGFLFNNTVSLTNSTALLFDFRNNGTSLFALLAQDQYGAGKGRLVLPELSEIQIGSAVMYGYVGNLHFNQAIRMDNSSAIQFSGGTEGFQSVGTGIVGINGSLATSSATKFLYYNGAPTLSGFGGTGVVIANSNGTAAWDVNVGTVAPGSTGSFVLPAAANGWICQCSDITTSGTNETKQTGSSTTGCTITNYNTTLGTAANWTASDHLFCTSVAF